MDTNEGLLRCLCDKLVSSLLLICQISTGLEMDDEGTMGRCTLCRTPWMRKSSFERHKSQSRHQDLVKAQTEARRQKAQQAADESCIENANRTNSSYPISPLTLPWTSYDLSQPPPSLDVEALAGGFLAALSSSTDLAGKLSTDQVEAALTDALSGLPFYEAALWQGVDEAPAASEDESLLDEDMSIGDLPLYGTCTNNSSASITELISVTRR